jgi:hypothetical protein
MALILGGDLVFPRPDWDAAEWPWLPRLVEALGFRRGGYTRVRPLTARTLASWPGAAAFRRQGFRLERESPSALSIHFRPGLREGARASLFYRDGAGRFESVHADFRLAATILGATGGTLGHAASSRCRIDDLRSMDRSSGGSEPRLDLVDWLTILSPTRAAPGVDRLRADPGCSVDLLPNGAALVRVSEAPGFAEDEVSLRRLATLSAWLSVPPREPDVVYALLRAAIDEDTLPPQTFHPALRHALEVGLVLRRRKERRAFVERWNSFAPMLGAFVVPACDRPPADVADREEWLATVGTDAEQLRAYALSVWGGDDARRAFHEDQPVALSLIDQEFFTRYHSPDHLERLVRPLGAWLGEMLVAHARGRWHPRRDLDEAAVVVGDRAWLPFRLAKAYVASPEHALLHSFYAVLGEANGGPPSPAAPPTPKASPRADAPAGSGGFNVLAGLLRDVRVRK